MNEEQFNQLVAEIQSQGYPEETASKYAVLIGDTPTLDLDGSVIVTGDDGQQIAKLNPLAFFGSR